MSSPDLTAEPLDAEDPTTFDFSLVDPALFDISGLTPPSEYTMVHTSPELQLSLNSLAVSADPSGWTSESVTLEEMPLCRKLPDELKLHVFNKALDEITTCIIIVKRTMKEKGKSDVTIKRQWVFTYRMVTLESEAALLNVCTMSRQAYKTRKPYVLSLVTSGKKKLDNEICLGQKNEVIIDNESVFYIHHYLQRLRPPGCLGDAVFGWKNIKNLVIDSRIIKADIEMIQDDFERQIRDLEYQRRAMLAPEERRKVNSPRAGSGVRALN
ncbi:hypothetical protein BKA65DRAFT_559772 [Rhexocercosporidium sp. MPI-PUGE-AT-0058]|nr:hypothetical protein BKA65DRAFT_559772 [Rhexocercosporidium sp. MPI-PUGE-AT-0058]